MSTRSARTVSRSAANASASQAGPPASADQPVDRGAGAVVEQVEHVAVRVAGQRQLRWLDSRPCRYLAGDGSGQQQQPAGAGDHRRLLLGGRLEDLDADRVALVDQRRVGGDREAGAHLLDRAAAADRSPTPCRPVRATSGAAAVTVSRTSARSDACSAARSLPVATTRSPSTTRKVSRRWSGTLARSHASRGTVTPVIARSSRATASSKRTLPGRRAARSGRARPGRSRAPARSCVRSALGSDRISAITRSSRRPGTCQSKSSGAHPVEHRQRHVDGDAVGRRPGSNSYVSGSRDRLGAPHVGVRARVDLAAAGVDEHVAVEGQQVGLLPAGLLPPGVEVPAGHDVGGDPLVVEGEQRLVVDQDVAPAGPVLQLLDLVEQRPVVGEERVVGLPVALDQGVPDEQLPGQLRVDAAVVHLAGRPRSARRRG